MKPLAYIKKYKLTETNKFNHADFVKDLEKDFLESIDYSNKQNWSFIKFRHCVKEIKQKFDSISNKTFEVGIPETLWKYFYAKVICEKRDEMFGKKELN